MKKVMDDQNCGIGWKGEAHLTNLNFANDIALLADTRPDLQSMTTNLERDAGKIGLRLIIGEAITFPPIITGHQTTEVVKHFTYLASIVDNKGKVEADVRGLGKHHQCSKDYIHLVNVNN